MSSPNEILVQEQQFKQQFMIVFSAQVLARNYEPGFSYRYNGIPYCINMQEVEMLADYAWQKYIGEL